MRASPPRAAPRGRQPVDTGARGEAKDAQEVVFSQWRRRRHFEVFPPLAVYLSYAANCDGPLPSGLRVVNQPAM